MVLIVKYGDWIAEGRYNFHSRFRNHINFSSGSRLLTLTDKPEDAGPVNIVLNSIAFTDPDELTIQNTNMKFLNNKFSLTPTRKYSSHLQIEPDEFLQLENKLDLLIDLILGIGSEDSLKFLLQEKAVPSERTFRNELFHSIKAGVDLLFSCNISDGIKQIKGKGFGLTPSGDDLITGLLYGLHILQLQSYDLSLLRRTIYECSLTENQISGTYITLAAEGRYFADLKKLINTLIRGSDKEIRAGVRTFLDKGETSGADMLTGFVLTLNNRNKFVSLLK